MRLAKGLVRTLKGTDMERLTQKIRAGVGVTAAAVFLAACGGGGAPTTENPVTSAPPVSNYNGPPPATADVQAFKLNVWDNLRANNRCGACHNETQSPRFVRADDVNLAYNEANTIVDLGSPQDSQIVTKVGGGHNCWLSNDAACADIMTTWITNWAGDLAGGGGRQINLEAPVEKLPGDSKNFPDDGTLFSQTVHPLLTQYCQGCHTDSAATAQSPFFANADVDAAYEAAKSKIDLDDPANSRFVLRLRDEFHNCWDNCSANATEMENAITAFSNQIVPTQIDPALVVSRALTLYDGTVASGGNRYESAVIGMWEFKTGTGTTAFDTSGVEPSLDLTLSGDVEWFGGWGLNIKQGGKVQGSTTASRKLHDMIAASTGEYSIEAWVAPGNVAQEDSRIVSYSAGTQARNFNLGQTLYNYDFFNRSSNTDENGNPQVSTPDAAEVLQATLQHVVATYDPVEGRRIYVNGVLVTAADPAPGGTLGDWDDTFAFVLGNEVSGDRQWVGVVRLVAVHNRALTEPQILQNFEAGVGEKFFLLFGVEHLTNVAQSYVMVEGAQWDSYGYVFDKPTFVSLDGTAQPDGIALRGMRIGLNGAEVPIGQAYSKLDTMITAANYDPATGQQLADIGTVVPLEKGPDADEFFLTFDTLGANSFTRTPPTVTPPVPPTDPLFPVASDIGMRTFDEINVAMSEITTVSTTEPNVANTYATVIQSLPAIEQIDAFQSSHQIAVAQLAIEYCNALVEDAGLRSTVFPGFQFDQPPSVALAGAARNLLINPMIERTTGVTELQGIATQPDFDAIRDEMGYSLAAGDYPGNLIDRLIATGPNTAVRTRDIAKATCAGVMGSGALLVQ